MNSLKDKSIPDLKIFDAYAKHYDAFYENKDYQSETEYIEKFIKSFAKDAKSILDLGCGTGRHDAVLTEMGFEVTGVEISKTMLEVAERNLSSKKNLSYVKGDVRDIRIEKKFDAVISLFHVVSYQTENDDLKKTFQTAREHLKDDGVFIFDFWYGPGVITNKPESRCKKIKKNGIEIKRYAEPRMLINENLVDVNYKIFITKKSGNISEEINETHRMRYLFIPEIKFFLNAAGMDLVHFEEWLTGNELSESSWSGVCIAVKSKFSLTK